MIAQRRGEAVCHANFLCKRLHKTPLLHQEVKAALLYGMLPGLSDVPLVSFPQLPDKIDTATRVKLATAMIQSKGKRRAPAQHLCMKVADEAACSRSHDKTRQVHLEVRILNAEPVCNTIHSEMVCHRGSASVAYSDTRLTFLTT